MVLSLQSAGLKDNNLFLTPCPLTHVVEGRDALWDQLSCLLRSTPCNAFPLPVLSEAVSFEAARKQHDVPEVGTGEHRKEKGEQDYLNFEGGIEKQLKQEV